MERLLLFVKQHVAGAGNAVVWVQVENSASAAGYIAHNFFGQPSEKMKVVGVTGTNGKTTIATLIIQALYRIGMYLRIAEHGGKSYRGYHYSRYAYHTRCRQFESAADNKWWMQVAPMCLWK